MSIDSVGEFHFHGLRVASDPGFKLSRVLDITFVFKDLAVVSIVYDYYLLILIKKGVLAILNSDGLFYDF